ncbi:MULTISPECIES: hypothetical protein, partial [Asticcacaulis]|uniref:hypothetical protein n=1 Tax=Asticcacaulis TaxID=76890 RepID=UPI001AEA215F
PPSRPHNSGIQKYPNPSNGQKTNPAKKTGFVSSLGLALRGKSERHGIRAHVVMVAGWAAIVKGIHRSTQMDALRASHTDDPGKLSSFSSK